MRTLASIFLLAAAVQAEPPSAKHHVGDAFEITLTRVSEENGSNGSSGSSHDEDTVIERVIGVRPDGLELEYDLPPGIPKEERSSTWQFPARVFKPSSGPAQLLDRTEVEKRVRAWLEAAELPQSACGRLIFTWNAFRIECDPDAVLRTVGAFQLPADVREGLPYRDPNARTPGTLVKTNAGPNGQTFRAKMDIDPEIVRRARAETDVGVGEILRKPITLEAALAKHSNEVISGTISADLDVDQIGDVWRQTTLMVIEIKKPDGESETVRNTTTLERHRVSR